MSVMSVILVKVIHILFLYADTNKLRSLDIGLLRCEFNTTDILYNWPKTLKALITLPLLKYINNIFQ